MKAEKLCENLQEFYPNLECKPEEMDKFKSVLVDFYPFGYLASLELLCHGDECFISGDIPVPRKNEKMIKDAKEVITDRRCFLEDDHVHPTNVHVHPVCHAGKGNGDIILETLVSELTLKGKGD